MIRRPTAAIPPLMLLVLIGCSPARTVERVEWTTMGTVAAFQCRDKADLPKAQEVKAVFAEVERLLNAHNPESEIRRLAPLPDAEILAKCDSLVRPCYAAAFLFRDGTGGVFNPRFKGEGTMDLGAIAKGFAVDLAAERVGHCDALIDLGGNLKALGSEWKVGVYDGARAFTLRCGEACATSGEYFRGRHIRDGRTGGGVSNSVYSVTVVHPSSAMAADALSTILFIYGRQDGDAYLKANHPTASAIWL